MSSSHDNYAIEVDKITSGSPEALEFTSLISLIFVNDSSDIIWDN